MYTINKLEINLRHKIWSKTTKLPQNAKKNNLNMTAWIPEYDSKYLTHRICYSPPNTAAVINKYWSTLSWTEWQTETSHTWRPLRHCEIPQLIPDFAYPHCMLSLLLLLLSTLLHYKRQCIFHKNFCDIWYEDKFLNRQHKAQNRLLNTVQPRACS